MLENIILSLQNIPAEVMICSECIVCFVAIIVMTRFAGSLGLTAYIAIAVVVGNIQVLKTANFSFLSHEVALGTIVFSSSLMAVDILSEFYGKEEARRGIWIGFAATLLVSILMLITISIKPVQVNDPMDLAMRSLFIPMPSLFFASIISYLTSQHLDLWLFQRIRSMTSGKYLWLRTSVSGVIAALFDNIIFSTLAFVVFASHPISFEDLLYTYILGTLCFRFFVIILQTPVMYMIVKYRPFKP